MVIGGHESLAALLMLNNTQVKAKPEGEFPFLTGFPQLQGWGGPV